MTRIEKAEQLFASGLNCSQSVFCAFADEFGMDETTAAKVSCGLGGGVGRMHEVCGTVTGAALVLGMRHGPDKAVVLPKVQAFGQKFKETCGSVVCRELLAAGKRPCAEMVKLAVSMLEEVGP